MPSLDEIDRLLPQTQCGDCGYDGCQPYAKAILNGDSIDKCVPGGVKVLHLLAKALTVDSDRWQNKVIAQYKAPSIAVIDEASCIGCTKCIKACPVDCIVGAAKKMHTILADECTGCNKCIPACPVDCIDSNPIDDYHFDRQRAKIRHQAKIHRSHQEQPNNELLRIKNTDDVQQAKKKYLANIKRKWT